jgi:hypothetical protein
MMANEQNLKHFTSEYQPARRGRKPGSLNRATKLKKFMSVETDVIDLNGQATRGTVADALALALIKKAMQGDVQSYREIMDSLFGKISHPINFSRKDVKKLSDDELDRLIEQSES